MGILDPNTVYSDTELRTIKHDNHTTKTSLEAGYMLEEVSEVINETNTHVNTCEVYSHSCHCKIDSKDLKDIKPEVETLQRQMKSVNIVIDSTNAIIESMSAVLTPSNSESTGHHLPYDVRLETLLEEFSIILKEKNKTIIDIQEKLLLVENERDSLKLALQNLEDNIPAKSIINEQSKQKSYQSNGSANLNINTQDAQDIKNENNKIVENKSNSISVNGSIVPPDVINSIPKELNRAKLQAIFKVLLFRL